MSRLFVFCACFISLLSDANCHYVFDATTEQPCPSFVNATSECDCDVFQESLILHCDNLTLSKFEQLFQSPPAAENRSDLVIVLNDFQDDFPEEELNFGSEVEEYLSVHLKAMVLNKADSVTRLPDLSFARNLTKIKLEGLSNLTHGHFNASKLPSSLHHLIIQSTRITHLKSDMLDNLTNLRHLELVGQANIQLHKRPFGKLINLEELVIVGGLSGLQNDSLFGLSSLKHLNLTANNLDDLPDKLLHNLVNVDTVDFSHNDLTKLPRFLLDKNSQLRVFRAGGNDLSGIPHDFFRNTPELITLDLSKNRIPNLPKNIFTPLSKLEYLGLWGNHLQRLNGREFRNQSSLTELDLDANLIKSLTLDTFDGLDNLQQLNMSKNLISEIEFGTFRNLKKMTNLDLSHNQLNKFDGRIFGQRILSLDILNVSGNTIRMLSEDFAKFFNGSQVLLEDNSLVCSCDNVWLKNAPWFSKDLLCVSTCDLKQYPFKDLTTNNCIPEDTRFIKTNLEGFFLAGTIFFVASLLIGTGIAFAFASRHHDRQRFYPEFDKSIDRDEKSRQIKHISDLILTTAL